MRRALTFWHRVQKIVHSNVVMHFQTILSVAGACPHRRVRTCPTYCYVICIMVDHQLLNIDNHYDSLIKYAIYLSILAIPV